MFSFMASYFLFYFFNLEREKDSKKNAQKNVIILNSKLNHIFGRENVKISFSLFLEKL